MSHRDEGSGERQQHHLVTNFLAACDYLERTIVDLIVQSERAVEGAHYVKNQDA